MSNQTSENPKTPSHIVGIGASAGGLEAIESFFSKMPPNSGMAFVIIQHLSPDYKSQMAETLSTKTPMPVERAENGMLVQPDHVYLIIPNKNLTIFHGKLLLHEKEKAHGINLPIDIFLESLGEDQEERAIGIILSGTGSDGSRGIGAIKENGGFVLVQDEESARFDGMPSSAIATGLADFVMPPSDMPDQLLKFANHPAVSAENYPEKLLTDEVSLTRIFSLLREKHKVDFSNYKMSTVIRRIKRRMTVNYSVSLIDYVLLLESHSREVTALYKELLIGVTSFFRDIEAFQVLEETYLPELFRLKSDQELRFWVAGCATGEEAYSLAMLCKECLDQSESTVNVKIFATDLDEQAIMRASLGIYPETIAADLPPHYLNRYFIRRNENYQIVRSIREMVVFAQHNVLKDPPFTNIDFISCRNLLIYLQPVLQHKVLEFFNFSLNPNGLLFLGSSESISDFTEYFNPLSQKWKIYQSRGRIKHPEVIEEFHVRNRSMDYRRAYPTNLHVKNYQLERTLERYLDVLHSELILISIIVNDQFDIVHVVGDISKFFRVPTGSFTSNITHMAQKELAIPLATGLQQVFQTQKSVNYKNIILRIDNQKVVINMQIKALPAKRGQEPLAAVLIHEVDQTREKTDDPSEQKYDIEEQTERHIYDLEQELQFTREILQATIEELETSNEELQAANEELITSNEELRSTNEELQSINEELHTVNSEYHRKIMELSELNNDVDNMMANTAVGTLFLDENLEIRKFSPQVKTIFNISEKDLERPISDLALRLPDIDLAILSQEVQNSGNLIEEEIQTANESSYLVRFLPYYINSQTVSGIIITFIDITNLHKAKVALLVSERNLRIATALTKTGYWEIDLDSMQTVWTDEVYRIHDIEPGSYRGMEKGSDFYHPDDRLKMQAAIQACIDQGTSFDLELRFMGTTGLHKWIRAIGAAEKCDGKIVSVHGAYQDITELVQTQLDLKDSQTEYRVLFDTISSGVIIYEATQDGADFLISDLNGAAEEICQASRGELIGKSVQKAFPDVQAKGLLKVLQDVWKTGEPASLPLTEYSDERLHLMLENRVYKLPTGAVVVVFDVINP